MIQVPDDPFATVDTALLRLRRFAQAPPGHSAPGPREPVEISTVLVVDSVEQLSTSGASATVGTVAERLSVAPSTASRLIERAAAAGMVERVRAAGDSRRVNLLLTEAGGALAARARQYRYSRLAEVLASWPPERIERFSMDLHDFAQLALIPQDRNQP